MRREKNTFSLGSSDFQIFFAVLRILLLLAILGGMAAYCSTTFHDVDPREVAQSWRERVPLVFGGWSNSILVPITLMLNPYSGRYIVLSLVAITLVILGGANYVRDVYALKKYKSALLYVIASLFTLRYPKLTIDKNLKDNEKQAENLIKKIGGPGYVIIEPGNAATFRHLREPGLDLVSATHFVAPFETVAQVIDLDEQQGDADEVPAMTRDGIKVILRDIHMRYRIKQEVRLGKPALKKIEDPYPLASDALSNMLYSMTIAADGPDKWNDAVERVIIGGITDFISEHSIDYLTAPRNGTPNPRIELTTICF